LIITDQQGNPVEYKLQNGKPISREVQRLQKTLFHQKQTIIENCLFGVDINSKSVLICRLRLWIELLKNAYYKETEYNELETLPNIDINIKCGNSLLSRFAIDADLSKALKSIKYNIKAYRGFVNDYKNEKNRDVKRGLQKIIDSIKADFKTYVGRESKEQKKLDKLSEELFNKYFSNKLFSSNLSAAQKKDRKSLEEQVAAQKKIIDDINNSVIYKNAFEWRFEFPEVLNNKGEFGGFDLIIGNPPYGVSLKDNLREAIVNKLSKVPDYEIYYFFINLSKSLLKPNGIKTYIIPNTILFNVFAKNYRENLFQNWQIQEILDCTDFNVFEGSATVRCIITQFINKKSDDIVYYRPTANVSSFDELKERKQNKTTKTILLENNQNWALVFKLSSDVLQLVSKIKSNKKSLENYFPEFSQGLIAYDKYQGQDEFTIKNRIFHSTTKQAGWKKWLWGEDITPYSVKWNGKEYINYSDGIANPRDPKYFKGERILVREITNPKIFAGYTDEEGYNDPAIINILKNKKGGFELKTLLAILNSKLATFYHFNSSPKATKGAFPKILVEDIKTFPLPTVSSNQQLNIIKLSDKIISLKQQGKDSIEQEKKIDELVYKLYDITNEEIIIIES
jgi:adenine-specific DNA-methyltransferase